MLDQVVGAEGADFDLDEGMSLDLAAASDSAPRVEWVDAGPPAFRESQGRLVQSAVAFIIVAM